MIILAVRTDAQDATVIVFKDGAVVAEKTWHAYKELAETINKCILGVMREAGVFLHELDGIIAYKGPGSFTGLRIGLTVVNAIAFCMNIPMAGTRGDKWIEDGLQQLADKRGTRNVMPDYGAEPHITKPKK